MRACRRRAVPGREREKAALPVQGAADCGGTRLRRQLGPQEPPAPGFHRSHERSGRLMPKRSDIGTVLIIGAGPIVIGQAAEFDYSGSQAVKALKAEGYRVIVVNSNPATIMTDPELADVTYIEPITPGFVASIIEKERPKEPGGFAVLPTMGGQTALNTAL